MTNQNKLNLVSTQANKLIAELPERREKSFLKRTQVQFRHDMLESQKRVNYQSEFDWLQGANKLPALQPNVKSRMNGLQSMARRSLKGETHSIYRTKF